MALQLSTGLRSAMLDAASFRDAMAASQMFIYSGTPPADADALATGNILAHIGDGFTLGWATSATAGELLKTGVWQTAGITLSGVATYYRLVIAGDVGDLSTTASRVQGAIGTAGKELNLTNTTLTQGANLTIDYYSITLPTL